jgi:hypothetical protein
MPDPTPLQSALARTLTPLDRVVADFKTRTDLGKDQATALSTLGAFRQAILVVQANTPPEADALKAVSSQAEAKVLPLLHETSVANLRMAGMGQLNTARTLTPEVAKSQAANLGTLTDAVQALLAQIAAAAGPSMPGADVPVPNWKSFSAGELRADLPQPGVSAGET